VVTEESQIISGTWERCDTPTQGYQANPQQHQWSGPTTLIHLVSRPRSSNTEEEPLASMPGQGCPATQGERTYQWWGHNHFNLCCTTQQVKLSKLETSSCWKKVSQQSLLTH
jgi:hypothetical protein